MFGHEMGEIFGRLNHFGPECHMILSSRPNKIPRFWGRSALIGPGPNIFPQIPRGWAKFVRIPTNLR